MKHQIKTFDGKLLLEMTTVQNGTELYTTNEMSVFKKKLSDANKDHGNQFDNDITSLNNLKQECLNTGVDINLIVKNKFSKVSESWGLTYVSINDDWNDPQLSDGDMPIRQQNALKNTFPDLEIQKEVEPQTQLEELNDYLRMLADMDKIGIRRKLLLLEGYMNKVISQLKNKIK
jgi:hypothetical protein